MKYVDASVRNPASKLEIQSECGGCDSRDHIPRGERRHGHNIFSCLS